MIDIKKIMDLVLDAARQARESAGLSGSWGDGGASVLEAQVKFYNYGKRGVIPDEWKTHTDKADPEYATYLRLKEKFKNIT